LSLLLGTQEKPRRLKPFFLKKQKEMRDPEEGFCTWEDPHRVQLSFNTKYNFYLASSFSRII